MKKNYLKKNRSSFIFAILLSLMSGHLCAADYYVSALIGTDSNDGLTSSTPFRTIQNAADLTDPGDTVYIMNGTYDGVNLLYSNHATVLYISRSGAENAYITYKNYAGHSPKISGVNSIWNCVEIRANYIKIEGLEVEGPNQNITYQQAKDVYDHYVNTPPASRDWDYIATMNTNGISFGGGPMVDSIPWHHIEIANSIVHDFQGGGIGGGDCDYITIENNIVYNNSWYGMYATSGISLLGTKDFDNNNNYKIIVRGNKSYNNKTLIPWAGRGFISDGNGIIIDSNINSDGTPYAGTTLVDNNVSYNNGGSGIHAFHSNNVDIINNTAYNNGTVVGYAEIFGQSGTNLNIYNNIMYARTGGNCNTNDPGATYDYNIYFNGAVMKQGANDLTTNPKFVKLAFDGTANLNLRSTSPAINSGTGVPGNFSQSDIDGVARPVGAKPDRGAYESPYLQPAVVAEMTVRQGASTISNNAGQDFGSVPFDAPETLTFTVENNGGADLLLTGNPKVVVSGEGFSLTEDALGTIGAGDSATFSVALTTSSVGQYTGTISIANSDAYENPYVITVTGEGLDSEKGSQTITFNALPAKNLEDQDFDPMAVSSAGLLVSYTSSVQSVATSVNGNIHVVGPGRTIITASQAGDANTNAAADFQQTLSVIPVMNLSTANLIDNPDFNSGTSGWSFSNQNSGAAVASSITKVGYFTPVGNVVIDSTGTSSSVYNVQFGINIPVETGKKYAIMFKASADADGSVNLAMFKNQSPWSTMFNQGNIGLTAIPATYGPYYYDSTTTESLAFRFLLGKTTGAIYIDDVEIREVLDATLGIGAVNKETAFMVFPNPAKDRINIVPGNFQGRAFEASLINYLGQELTSKTFTDSGDSLSVFELGANIPSGVYLLRITGENSIQVKTIVIKK
jgi:hypothetical protein